MRCTASKGVRKARGAADIANIGKPSNAADALAGSNPKGRERLAPGSALLSLTMGPPLSRLRALNQAPIAPRRMRESKSDRLPARRRAAARQEVASGARRNVAAVGRMRTARESRQSADARSRFVSACAATGP